MSFCSNCGNRINDNEKLLYQESLLSNEFRISSLTVPYAIFEKGEISANNVRGIFKIYDADNAVDINKTPYIKYIDSEGTEYPMKEVEYTECPSGEKETTNNKMELTAVIKALTAAKNHDEIEIHTDSQYVKNGMESWIKNWKKNNWKTSTKKPVKNVELWKQLDEIASTKKIHWVWVKGHAGHPENERVDTMACLQRDNFANLK